MENIHPHEVEARLAKLAEEIESVFKVVANHEPSQKDLLAGLQEFEKFDMQGVVIDGAKTDDSEAVLLVDIGRNQGSNVEAHRRAFAKAPGKLVLQEVQNDVHGRIRNISQSACMFDERPVKGARA
ncbi:hypothetical protein B0H63DRAFT_550497 [Podospora didyma]|uniref:Uncharacterized protein n=1 Tax=Podospora didyma TaxID=330526 RepID=A0AAE0K8X5_9PEZI|nr:hypothetical protein B0H63DRAFT_550497 [Podospora didyma]